MGLCLYIIHLQVLQCAQITRLHFNLFTNPYYDPVYMECFGFFLNCWSLLVFLSLNVISNWISNLVYTPDSAPFGKNNGKVQNRNPRLFRSIK